MQSNVLAPIKWLYRQLMIDLPKCYPHMAVADGGARIRIVPAAFGPSERVDKEAHGTLQIEHREAEVINSASLRHYARPRSAAAPVRQLAISAWAAMIAAAL